MVRAAFSRESINAVFVDNAGNVGIGTSTLQCIFQVRSKPTDSGAFTAETTAGALLKSLTDNGGNGLLAPESMPRF